MPSQLNRSLENKKMELELLDYIESQPNQKTQSITQIIKHLKEKPWTLGIYKKENWGNRLHSVAPYIGRIKPSFAHWIIRISTQPGSIVLDPFCGIGTVPLEADLLGRKAIGFDLNDYAIAITKAKFDRRPLEDNLNWLSKIDLKKKKFDTRSISDYVKQFYHPKTLQEFLNLREKIKKEKRDFLLGCLIGICHGHRPQYLSAWTGYIIPFSPKTKAEYKPVIPRMLAKVKRMYETGFPLESNTFVAKHDARTMNLPDNSVDIIISSPPYFDTIDYVTSNRLRLAMLGIPEDDNPKLKESLIQKERDYLEQMKVVGNRLVNVLKDGSLCIFVLGDLHKNKRTRNTAAEVAQLYQDFGFENLAIIEDEIPLARRTANKWKGKKELAETKRKLDRVLVMRLHK